MTNFDLSPLYRSTVGFDHVFDMLDQASRTQPATWPPYNIERLGEDQYRIVLALAGFAADEIELVQKENALLVAGQRHPEPEGVEVLHRGIATRAFKQTFNLADHMKVTGANLENGLLTVELKREVPEALKPRRIDIASSHGRTVFSQDNRPEQIEQASKAA
jgi:molecular chaperone IbpA